MLLLDTFFYKPFFKVLAHYTRYFYQPLIEELRFKTHELLVQLGSGLFVSKLLSLHFLLVSHPVLFDALHHFLYLFSLFTGKVGALRCTLLFFLDQIGTFLHRGFINNKLSSALRKIAVSQ